MKEYLEIGEEQEIELLETTDSRFLNKMYEYDHVAIECESGLPVRLVDENTGFIRILTHEQS